VYLYNLGLAIGKLIYLNDESENISFLFSLLQQWWNWWFIRYRLHKSSN